MGPCLATLPGKPPQRRAAQAADALAGTCPQEIPLTPTGRLAAIEKRLDALTGALDTLRPALERFYA